jgi:hypothetical protein
VFSVTACRISPRVIIELLGGCPQPAGCVLGVGFPVAEAGDAGVKAGELAEGCGGLGTVGVEHAGHDLPVGPGGGRVTGEPDTPLGKAERDATRSMPGHGHRDGAAADAELVTVTEFAVDPHRDRERAR